MGRCDEERAQCLNWHIHDWLLSTRPSGSPVNGVTVSYKSLCPVHDDAERSLSVSVGEKARIVWHCHAGCDPLAVRAGLIRQGVPADCLPLPRDQEVSVIDQMDALYTKRLGHAELRWRIYSLLKGFGGEMPPRGAYPGGRRAFARDAGVSPPDLYGCRGNTR